MAICAETWLSRSASAWVKAASRRLATFSAPSTRLRVTSGTQQTDRTPSASRSRAISESYFSRSARLANSGWRERNEQPEGELSTAMLISSRITTRSEERREGKECRDLWQLL